MDFKTLGIKDTIVRAVEMLGFNNATLVQELSIPVILEGKDIVAQSGTGSGKTAAFGLPLIQKITPNQGLQAVILTPTRELCLQVTKALRDFSKFAPLRIVAVYGGVGIEPQITALRDADIVVGTPGRILDHMNRNTIDFSNVQFLVLDEADKMFEMGFIEDVEEIVQSMPEKRQTLLFSATMPPKIRTLVQRYLYNPVPVTASEYVDQSLLKQVYYDVPSSEKFSLLAHLLKNKTPGLAIVFCATRSQADIVARNLADHGVKAKAIHGGLTQNKRTQAMDSLRKEHISVLVATDVAARGIDVQNISHVYNYAVPKSSEEYIHRIGRTARAGKAGEAVTLLSRNDYENFDRVLQSHKISIDHEPLPEFEHLVFHARPVQSRDFRGSPRGSRPRMNRFRGRSSSSRH